MECDVNLTVRGNRIDDPQRLFHLKHGKLELTDHRGTVVVDIDVSESKAGGGNGGGPAGQSSQDAAVFAFGVRAIELNFSSHYLDPVTEEGAYAIHLLSRTTLPPTEGAHLMRMRYSADLWHIYVIQDMQWAPDWIHFEVVAVS